MKITIIHTTPATISRLSELFHRELPEATLCNMLDDSLLSDMVAGINIEAVRSRWTVYATLAAQHGADAVLSACSTVGEFAEEANRQLSIPVYRIDEAMAIEAVRRGGKIAVLATLPTTLQPTSALISRLAAECNCNCQLAPQLVAGAYDLLIQGNHLLHDQLITAAICSAAASCDVIVLAQASMASAAAGLSDDIKCKLLTSPELGICKLRNDMRKLGNHL